jgi:voltage-gated potassium channel
MRHPDTLPRFTRFILALIILNTLSVMLESVESLHRQYGDFLYWFEVASVAIFTFEYIWRVAAAKKKSRFIFSFFGLIDLIAILPFFLPFLIAVDLRFVRILRLIRIFRVFKVARYSKSLRLVGEVLREKKEALLLTLFMSFLMLMVSSALMYEVEHHAQPDKFPDIFSSFWWAIATLTTVGYGDVYPVTAAGKFISGVIALLGIGVVALPTGIISSGFIERMKSDKRTCPHCGKEL